MPGGVTISNLSKCEGWATVFQSFFFFQAEDGIRDTSVTGVQTCALPISKKNSDKFHFAYASNLRRMSLTACGLAWPREIGRASCRERVEMACAAAAV